MRNILAFLAVIFSISLPAQPALGQNKTNTSPEVRTKPGVVRGVTKDDVTIFKGIPFAAPPVGENRWRPPQPVKAWEGVRDAISYGANCAQAGWGAAPGTIAEGSSEDCLYLNLWMPAQAKSGAKLPVMVWIHGGAFVMGSGSGPDVSGENFARQGRYFDDF